MKMGLVVVGQRSRSRHTSEDSHSTHLVAAAQRWDGHMGPRLDSGPHTAIYSKAEEEQKSAEWSRMERSHLAGMVGRFEREGKKNWALARSLIRVIGAPPDSNLTQSMTSMLDPLEPILRAKIKSFGPRPSQLSYKRSAFQYLVLTE